MVSGCIQTMRECTKALSDKHLLKELRQFCAADMAVLFIVTRAMWEHKNAFTVSRSHCWEFKKALLENLTANSAPASGNRRTV